MVLAFGRGIVKLEFFQGYIGNDTLKLSKCYSIISLVSRKKHYPLEGKSVSSFNYHEMYNHSNLPEVIKKCKVLFVWFLIKMDINYKDIGASECLSRLSV